MNQKALAIILSGLLASCTPLLARDETGRRISVYPANPAYWQYKGKPVGYNIVMRMNEQDASFLADMGVKVETDEDTKQRKFRTQSPPKVVDVDS